MVRRTAAAERCNAEDSGNSTTLYNKHEAGVMNEPARARQLAGWHVGKEIADQNLAG